VKITFAIEKTTANFVRYEESAPADGSAPLTTGKLYLRKSALEEEYGTTPDTITVTIEAE
jgi:hypothetical protein